MITYIGLDFEASGSNPWEKHVPIQIGVYIDDKCFIGREIGGWDWNVWDWNEEASKVHNIPKEDLITANPVWKVDVEVTAFIMDRVSKGRMWNIPVGWNVAGYDGQFITRWFPNLRRLLSYRSVDLNALVYALAGDSEEAYQGIKKAIKDETASKIRGGLGWHDALYDAQAARIAFDILRERLGQ